MIVFFTWVVSESDMFWFVGRLCSCVLKLRVWEGVSENGREEYVVAFRIGVTSGVWARRKVVLMCAEVGGLGKFRRKMFWGNSPSISSWSNSVCASISEGRCSWSNGVCVRGQMVVRRTWY
jgi:hypothetical protein